MPNDGTVVFTNDFDRVPASDLRKWQAHVSATKRGAVRHPAAGFERNAMTGSESEQLQTRLDPALLCDLYVLSEQVGKHPTQFSEVETKMACIITMQAIDFQRIWWEVQVSNLRPLQCECSALPLS